ncbi:hypothetical protein F4780DRAFT_426791 [Xylariomycetidae sp. FL0641]|nr:hypothetical protein F4780DRAFT_426791 [Xylariomycetidae sp. FL0641]
MVAQSSAITRRISVLCFIIVVALLYWKSGSSRELDRSDISDSTAARMPSPASNLKVSVRQSNLSPPKLTLGVTNTHSDPVTILSWNSPLDPLALQLGLLSFYPSGSDKPIEIAAIQIRRKMPPGADALVTIPPGETKEQELELREPIVPLKQLKGNVKVVCKGEWTSVWPSKADDVSAESLEKLGASDGASTGSFESDPVQIEL